jgi:hypothetical protein
LRIDYAASGGKNLLTSPARGLQPTTKNKLAAQGQTGCIAMMRSVELVDGRPFDFPCRRQSGKTVLQIDQGLHGPASSIANAYLAERRQRQSHVLIS